MAPNFVFSEENKDESDEFLEYQLSIESACDRVSMIVDQYGADSVTLLTSFGVQSGVMLSIVAEACPEIRVLYIDTQGPTSERDLEYGRQVLDIVGLKNFTVAKADVTREEFQKGMKEVGITPDDGDNDGNNNVFHTLSQDVFKVTPLKQECASSGVQCLLSGVRRGQTSERNHFKFIQYSQDGPDRAHPILDWSDSRCLEFLRVKGIPPHPELSSVLTVINNASNNNKKHYGRSSSLRSERPSDRGEGRECGIHVQAENTSQGNKHPVPTLPNVVVGKVKCKFCIGAKNILTNLGIEYVEAPVHLFSHLIPAGTKTVPVVYLNKQLIGGYGNLCEYLKVEDTLNTK